MTASGALNLEVLAAGDNSTHVFLEMYEVDSRKPLVRSSGTCLELDVFVVKRQEEGLRERPWLHADPTAPEEILEHRLVEMVIPWTHAPGVENAFLPHRGPAIFLPPQDVNTQGALW